MQLVVQYSGMVMQVVSVIQHSSVTGLMVKLRMFSTIVVMVVPSHGQVHWVMYTTVHLLTTRLCIMICITAVVVVVRHTCKTIYMKTVPTLPLTVVPSLTIGQVLMVVQLTGMKVHTTDLSSIPYLKTILHMLMVVLYTGEDTMVMS